MIDATRNASAPQKNSSRSTEMSIFDIWGIFRRRKWLVLFGLVFGLGAAILYYSKATPIYESRVEVLVMPKNQSLATAGPNGVVTTQQQEVVDEGIMATHVQLLKSPRIIMHAINPVAYPFGVAKKSATSKNVDETRKTTNLLQLRTFQEAIALAKKKGRRFDLVGFITNDHLSVTTGGEGKAKDARVLKATFRGPYPEDNAKILAALVKSYREFLGETFSQTSSEAVDLITKLRDNLDEELAELDNKYRKFREQVPLFWKGKESLNLHQERLAKIEESLTEITQRYTETKARLQVIEEAIQKKGGIDKLSDVEKLALLSESDVSRLSLLVDASRPDRTSEVFQASSPIRQEQAQAEYQRLLSLLLDETQLIEDYGPDHPKVKAVREKIKLTRDFLEKNSPKIAPTNPGGLKPGDLLEAHLGLLRHDLAELEKRKTDLTRIEKTEEKAAKDLVGYELQDENMRGEIERKKELYKTIIDHLREVSLIKDYGGYITEVIAPPTVPDRQASPRLLLVIGLGGVLGLLFGCGIALLVDLADKTFRDPDDVCEALDLPILAHVPRLRIAKTMRKAANQDGDGRIVAPEVIVYHNPNGPEAEAIRGLRTALYFGSNGLKYKVLQVTSPNPGDGKTTVAANLAVTTANSGRRVLMIDADLRRPRLERLFDARADVGLAEVLSDEVEWVDVIQETKVSNLWILPCGKPPSNPSELLTLDRFDEFLALVRECYDLVIIDSPPLLAVSDAAIIAPRVDGVLLTIRIKKNGGPLAVHAKEMLSGMDANIAGIVVNDVEENKTYRQSYYGKRYGYGYGYRKKYGYGYGYGYTYGEHGQRNGKRKLEKVES